ncbi:MAG: hypothetical protein AAFO03_16280 [Bacteroidota bacterium]
MKQLTLLYVALLWAMPSLTQTCDTLICSDGFFYTLYPTDGECLWPIPATDFLDESLASCATSLDLAIYPAHEVITQGDDFEPTFGGQSDTLWITGDYEETTVVYVYSLLPDGTVQECISYVLLLEHIAIECYGTCLLSGLTATYDNEPIADVTIKIVGGLFGETTLAQTNTQGTYNLEIDEGSYQITAERNDNHLNGVSTFDIVLIGKYILGVQDFEQPYHIIAADVNQSGTVSVFDLIQMRKLVLNVITEFPDSPSWRFIPASYSFPVPANPWHETFPELIEIEAISDGLIEVDFIGIKMGDVNSSVIAN